MTPWPRPAGWLLCAWMLALAACGDTAARPLSAAKTPTAAAGLAVQAFASGLQHPGSLLVLPNGDVLVGETQALETRPGDAAGLRGWVAGLFMRPASAAEPSASRITLLRDSRGTGVADERHVLLEGLRSPCGLAVVGDKLYVAHANAVLRYPFRTGDTRITAPGTKVVALPGGRINERRFANLMASADGQRVFLTLDSKHRANENDEQADTGGAAIREVQVANGSHRVYASGLGNALGLAANAGNTLGPAYAQGLFVGRQSPRDRQDSSGYEVVFVPFEGQQPSGAPRLAVLSGFLSPQGQAPGRPVGVAVDKRGALLVADDLGHTVWRVSAAPLTLARNGRP